VTRFILTVGTQYNRHLDPGSFDLEPSSLAIDLFRFCYFCYREAWAFQDCLASMASQEKMVMIKWGGDPKVLQLYSVIPISMGLPGNTYPVPLPPRLALRAPERGQHQGI